MYSCTVFNIYICTSVQYLKKEEKKLEKIKKCADMSNTSRVLPPEIKKELMVGIVLINVNIALLQKT